MKKRNKKSVPVILLAAATILLLASTIGSTQAALTYYSQNYSAEVTVSSIGVSLLENGETVSHRDYLQDDEWSTSTGTLLENLLAEDEEITLGKTYDEVLSVKNSGSIDTYVRVILHKSWQDAEGVKDPTLSPDLIDLNLVTGNGWVVDADASTAERTVLYYTGILPVGAETPALTDTLWIDPIVGTKLLKTEVQEDGDYKTVTYIYEYDGYTFTIEAEVDAVQTHNAQDAIKSAWGVDVSVAADGSISLR